MCWQPTEHKEIIQHLAKLADSITVAMARASILWLIGEYSDRVPKIAPDVLRKMAKTFIDEVTPEFFVSHFCFGMASGCGGLAHIGIRKHECLPS